MQKMYSNVCKSTFQFIRAYIWLHMKTYSKLIHCAHMYTCPNRLCTNAYIFTLCCAGLMGSLASLKQFKFMSPQDDNVSGGDLSLHSVKRRQIFTQTAI